MATTCNLAAGSMLKPNVRDPGVTTAHVQLGCRHTSRQAMSRLPAPQGRAVHIVTIEQCALLISHTGPSTWEHHQVRPLFGKLQHFLMDVGLSGICVQQQQR